MYVDSYTETQVYKDLRYMRMMALFRSKEDIA